MDLNTDLPLRLPALMDTVAHETYPGHHLEHAWKEADLVEQLGQLEASVLLINTPECLISEGLADLGREFVVPARRGRRTCSSSCSSGRAPSPRSGRRWRRPPARHPGDRHPQVLAATRVNAALLRHADGRSHADVLDYLVSGRSLHRRTIAAKRLEFIEHPMWRTYVFVYTEGEALLRRWLEAARPERRPVRPPPARAAEPVRSRPRSALLGRFERTRHRRPVEVDRVADHAAIAVAPALRRRMEVADIERRAVEPLAGVRSERRMQFADTYSNTASVDGYALLSPDMSPNCIPSFTAYTGKGLDGATLDVGYFHPTSEGWGDGDRGVICYAINLDGSPMTGSLKAAQ